MSYLELLGEGVRYLLKSAETLHVEDYQSVS